MSTRPNFDWTYIHTELRRLGSALKQKVTIFVAGGAVMAFLKLKIATKDIDVIVRTNVEVGLLDSCLRSLGYAPPKTTLEYSRMMTNAILENAQGFRWDLFHQVLAGKLSLSKGMIFRSQLFDAIGQLEARMLSKDDIFLLKSVTDRDLDLDDMRIIAESGVDWQTVRKECQLQAQNSTQIWENALCEKLIELRKTRNITSPIEKEICRIADQKILEQWIIKEVTNGRTTVKALAKASQEPEVVIRRAVELMAQRGSVRLNRSKRPYEISK
ncbi:MAG TPA: hypothetical protein VEG61_09225 [Candidatus Dormibacteraeota bacterium]|nr:hypothetical protein [Candidatus Dormibacteraeota bacterium]